MSKARKKSPACIVSGPWPSARMSWFAARFRSLGIEFEVLPTERGRGIFVDLIKEEFAKAASVPYADIPSESDFWELTAEAKEGDVVGSYTPEYPDPSLSGLFYAWKAHPRLGAGVPFTAYRSDYEDVLVLGLTFPDSGRGEHFYVFEDGLVKLDGPGGRLVSSPEEAADVALAFGYPVLLRAVNNVLHPPCLVESEETIRRSFLSCERKDPVNEVVVSPENWPNGGKGGSLSYSAGLRLSRALSGKGW